MAEKKLRIELNSAQARAVLQSRAVLADLLARGNAIADATGSPEEFEVRGSVGATRARVSVLTATYRGRYLEATDRVLTQALDAGRG